MVPLELMEGVGINPVASFREQRRPLPKLPKLNLAKMTIKTAVSIAYFNVRRRIRPSSPCYITCHGQRDGFGAQAIAAMSTILFARNYGFVYLHTPFADVAHNPGVPDWTGHCEAFFSLGVGEQAAQSFPSLPVRRILNPVRTGWKTGTLFSVPHCHAFANLFPAAYEPLRATLRAKYYTVSKEPYEQPGARPVVTIAVHVRRGDVASSGRNANRYTDWTFVISTLEGVSRCLKALNLGFAVHLYSNAAPAEIPDSGDLDWTLHLNEDPLRSFHDMVRADILILAKSSFSYTAAILSDAVVLYEPFFHAPLADWVRLEDTAKFDAVKFTDRVKARMAHRA